MMCSLWDIKGLLHFGATTPKNTAFPHSEVSTPYLGAYAPESVYYSKRIYAFCP